MQYETNVYQMTVEDHTFWVAESKALKGCVGQGETSEEAIAELEANEIDWIETARELGIPIPPQSARKEVLHNGKFALRMSPYLHEKTATLAASQNISLNQYINNAVSEYNVKVEFNLKSHRNDITDYTEKSGKIVKFEAIQNAPVYNVSLEEREEM